MAKDPGERRLFFALWPPAAVQRQLADQARRATAGKGRVPPPSNIHLTLAFAGAVDAPTEACLWQRAEAVTVPPFRLALDHRGYWARKRLLWVGPSDPPEALLALGRQLRQALPDCGLAAPHRDFTPHVTLARKAPRPRTAGPPAEPPAWRVASFALVASQRRAHGAEYSQVGVWPLTETHAFRAGGDSH
jgi:2'-5' RNA ligase